jgi:hypothetical protein
MRQLAGGVEQCILHDVGRVQAGREPRVQVDGDHPPQPVAIAGKQLLPGRLISPAGAAQQLLAVRGLRSHSVKFPYDRSAEPAEKVTRKRPTSAVRSRKLSRGL